MASGARRPSRQRPEQQASPPPIPFLHPPTPWARRDTWLLLAVFAAALLVRFLYLWQYRSNPFFVDPAMDPRNHDLWARSLLAGRDFLAGHPYFRAPLYPYFLAGTYAVSGGSYLAPRVAQALLGTLSAGGVLLIARHYFGRWTGFAAGLVAATFWLFVYFEGELLIVSLAIALDLAALWCFIHASERGAPRLALASGLLLGLSALARPNILAFAALAFVWLLIRARADARAEALERREARAGSPPRKRAAARLRPRHALLLLLGCLLPIVPVTVRNVIVSGDLVLIASQGGLNLYIGNNPQADGTTPELPGEMADWRGSYFESIARAEAETGRTMKPSQVSRHYTRRALAYALSHPLEWLGLTARKVHYFWNRVEIGNNQPITFFAHHFAPVSRYLPIGYGLFAPLGLLGLLLALRAGRRGFPLWGFVLSYSASIIVFFVCTRFKMPVLPVLIVLAAGTGAYLIRLVRARRLRALVPAGVLLLASALWVNSEPAGFRPEAAHGFEMLGMRAMERGDVAAGLDAFRQGLAAHPRYPAPLYIHIGHAELARGDLDAAEAAFQRGLTTQARHPREFARGTAGLGLIAERRNLAQAAIEYYVETVRLDPRQTAALARLVELYAARGEREAALEWAERAVHLAPGSAAAWTRLAELLHAGGDTARARQAFLRALDALRAERRGREGAPTHGVYPGVGGAPDAATAAAAQQAAAAEADVRARLAALREALQP